MLSELRTKLQYAISDLQDAFARLDAAGSIVPADEITLAECVTLVELNKAADEYAAVELAVSLHSSGTRTAKWKVYGGKPAKSHEGERLCDAYRAWLAAKQGADPVQAATETVGAAVDRPDPRPTCDKCGRRFDDGQAGATDCLCAACISAAIPF